MTISDTLAPSPAPRPFAPRHPLDRWFFPLTTALVWLGIIMGFGGEMLRLSAQGKLTYPLIVHVHAAVFTGWLVVFTLQVALVSRRRVDLHKRLGLLAAGLVAVMIVLGPWTALVMAVKNLGVPGANPPAFLAVPLSDMISFAVLAVVGLLKRKDVIVHKRLMLLATLALADAGFGRWTGAWLGPILEPMLGEGFWALLLIGYPLSIAAVLIVPAYDLFTRGRVHPLVAGGAALVVGLQATATALFVSPAWTAVADAFVRRLAGV